MTKLPVLRRVLALAALIVGTIPAMAAERPATEKLRFEEDWSTFAPAPDAPLIDRLKSIRPLGQESLHLSIGGSLRERYENTTNPGFGADPQDDKGVWLQRATLHGDLRFGERFRVFTELHSSLEAGRAGGPSPVDQDDLTLHNAFVEVRAPLSTGADATVRVGRIELSYGSERLIGVREGPNNRRSFNGATTRIDLDSWRLDAFAGRPTQPKPGVFDNRVDHDLGVAGLYTTAHRILPLDTSMDIYVLATEDDAPGYAEGLRDEKRYSFGTRGFGAAYGWDWNWEAIAQGGTVAGGDIAAWTLATDTGHTWVDIAWKPRLGLSANVASGDKDPTDGDTEAFNALFPRGSYFSEAAVFGPRNFFNLHPSIALTPRNDLALSASVNFLWRLETEDGVYAPNGRLLRAPGGSDARFVTTAFSAGAEWTPAPGVTLAALYSHLIAGEFIEDTGPDEDIRFLELTLKLLF